MFGEQRQLTKRRDEQWFTDSYCIIQGGDRERCKPYNPDIIQKIHQFVQALECPLTQQLGIKKYWAEFDRLGYCCGEPCLVLRTFDGRRITFIIAKHMIKLSGLAHTLKSNRGSKTKCWECVYKVSKLFREVIVPGFGLPDTTLSSDQSLKDCYLAFNQ